ncbi:O-antigen ligase family protein [Paenibacillus sp. 2RAB27]|uniref:O-antigen ligase family protein n=1 Tax=Paenibacillus sp. 2RAB27 TaxID=3232991 RepID=UPI003F9DCD0A
MYKKEKVITEIMAERKSVIYWLLMSFVIIFMVWAPFQKALFNGNNYEFERPIYTSLIWSSAIMFLISIYFFFNWKWKSNKDALSILVLFLPLTYLISLIPAASQYSATTMFYIQTIYITFFLIGTYLAKNKLGNSILTIALMGSGYFIVLFGLMNWFGNGRLAGSLVSSFSELTDGVYRDAVLPDYAGIRLTSVFQYANSYAAYLIALLFGALFFVSKSNRWSIVSINSFMLVPIILSFFFTLSRGAIVVIPVVLLILLFFMKLNRQILFLLHMGIAFIASFTILQKLMAAGIALNKQFSGSESSNNWLLLLSVSAVYTIVALLIQKFIAPIIEKKVERIKSRKLTNNIVPILTIVLGALAAFLIFSNVGATKLLPENLKNRLENINFAQNSVLERGTFYRDAMKVFKDHPILGAGGGAWSSLYEKYQNNPYVSRQAHNFFLQYLVEVGALGIIVFLLFLGSIFYLYIRSYFKNSAEPKDSHFLFFIITISLFIHSIIDFDLSYVYLGILVFLSLGAMTSNIGDAPFKWNLDKPLINKIYPSLLLVISIVMLSTSTRMLSANSSFKETIAVSQKSTNYNEIIKPLNDAIKLHPNHPNYALQKVGLDLQVYSQNRDEQFYNEALHLLAGLIDSEPYNRQMISQQLNAYQLKGQYSQAAGLADSMISNFPWDITIYEDSISLKVQAGLIEKSNKNSQAVDQNWDRALEIYNIILTKMKYLETLPKEQVQGRAFNVTNKIALGVSQIKLYKGDGLGAMTILKPYVNDQFDIPTNRAVARLYLAILQKQNTNDQALYDKLIAKDPNEKQQIETIVNMSTSAP